MRHKLLYLPCFVYATSFTLIVLLYKVGWSDLYPKLDSYLMIFLFCTIFISFIISLFQLFFLRINTSAITLSKGFINKAMLFLFLGYLLDFIYELNIPIIKTFLDPSFSYKDFTGIPMFHVVLSTFNIFFSVLMFEFYLCKKERKIFYQFLLTIIPYVLVMNRGAFMIVFSAMIFIYLMKLPKIDIKNILKSLGILCFVLYMFGIIGNVRQEQSKEDKEYLLRIGGASDSFIRSGVPAEFYWSYIYIISPIGNLQNIINEKEDSFNLNNLGQFVSTELFPDFISKRVVAIFGYQEILDKNESSNYFVTPLLNAPTTYYASYFLLGTVGMVLMFFVILISCVCYPLLVSSNSNYHLSSIAMLNSIILLSTFNNMWYATGTILLWPVIFSITSKLKL